jgi:ABC-type Fe3+/spermidine/putrescine transport system ATPase subunit
MAGLERADAGVIALDGRVITRGTKHVPPEERRVGLVFQTGAVWPHMTVEENVTLPLELQQMSQDDRKRKAREALEAVELRGLEDRKPSQLSGGQLQRVALARALVTNPAVMLFDEPLSSLDARLREELRTKLKRWHRDLGLTSIYVTHDQAEAMAIASRVAILSEGTLKQAGSPEEVYLKPADAFVARFLGQANFVSGIVASGSRSHATVKSFFGSLTARCEGRISCGSSVTAVVRPEDVKIRASDASGSWRIADVEFGGTITHYILKHEPTGETWCATELGRPTCSSGCAVSIEAKDAWILPSTADEAIEERLWSEGASVG